ncbi:MAG: hypothetical protein ABIR30_02025 [Chitinophagaceae bacterium]
MKPLYAIRFGLIFLFILSIFSCNEKEEFVTETSSDYYPQAVGKYITYRIDSMVFTNFGRNTEIHKYQVKHVIEAAITDNLGRSAYRVFVYIRDTAGLQPWQPAGTTYAIVPLFDQLEVIENNLRVIKMHLPIRNGFSWKGNKYLPTNPYENTFNFSNDDSMEDWDFYYDGEASSFSYRTFNYTGVRTIEQIDEAFNVPITVPTAYAARSRSMDKYAKNIGPVYREYELWEYQPNTGGTGGPYKIGFGITMWMIDHN